MGNDEELVDPLDQLVMSLAWDTQDGEYTNDYQRKVVANAIKFIYRCWQTGDM
jgi:hypothetical protein